MFPFWRKTEPTREPKFAVVARSLAPIFGLLSASLLSPGFKDLAIAAGNKAFGLNMALDAPWWTGLLTLGMCVACLFSGYWAERPGKGSQEGKPFIAFRHHSLRTAVPPLLGPDAIPAGLGPRTLSHLECDLTAQLANGVPSSNDLVAAVAEQRRKVEHLLSSMRTLPDAKAGYYGIAHVPLQVLAGRMLGPTVSPQLYELDGSCATWRPLLDGNGAKLHVRRTNASLEGPLTSACIRVSVSFEVSLDDVQQVIKEPFEDVHIRVANPARDIITHVGQVDAICREFRAALDSLHNRMAVEGRVHLFLAVPMSVGFSLGRVLSSSVNPHVNCYNHSTQATPKYAWSIPVNTDAYSGAAARPPLLPAGTPPNLP